MIKIYVADTKALSAEAVFRKYFLLMDEERKQKVRQCKREEDKKRSLLAGYLLQVAMREQTEKKSGLQENATPLSLSYRYGENGKPYLKNYHDIFFSLSHSGAYVIAVFSDREIGADLQEQRSIKEGLADRFFSTKDRELYRKTKLLTAGEEAASFCRIWAVKEAYMKLTGEGMKQGLASTALIVDDCFKEIWETGIIRGKGGDAYFHMYDIIEGYSLAVCSNRQETAEICRCHLK